MFSGIKKTAAQRLRQDSGTYRRLVRTHSGITVGVWLVLFVLSYLIQFLAPEGGLSNLGTHTMIFAAQITLVLVGLFLTPFWETGLSYVALDFIRGRRNMTGDLTNGFRYLKSILGSMIFRGIQYVLIYLLCSYATSVVLTLLPLSQAFYQDAVTLLQEPSTPLEGRMLIVAVVYGVVFASMLVFLSSQIFYRYRMTRYIILDGENIGGMKAANQSRVLMRGNKGKLLRLDLSFWWFYIPELLGIILPLSVLVISGLDLSLPGNWETASWIIAVFSLVLRLVVHYFAKPKLAAAYALFYEQLLKQDSEPTVEDATAKSSPKEPPKHVPWKY